MFRIFLQILKFKGQGPVAQEDDLDADEQQEFGLAETFAEYKPSKCKWNLSIVPNTYLMSAYLILPKTTRLLLRES